MKLTDRVLLAYLQERFEVKETARIGSSGPVQGPLLYEAGECPEEGWVYLLDGSGGFPENMAVPERILFILCGGMQGMVSMHGAVIALEEKEKLSEVLNALVRAFRFYGEWEQRLTELRSGTGTVEDMLEVSFPVLGNPMLLLLGHDFTIEERVGTEIMSDRYPFLGSGQEHMEYVNAVLQDPRYEEKHQSVDCYWGPDYITGFRSLNWNIRKGGETTHCLCLLEYKKQLTKADGDLLEILGRNIKYVLQSREGRGGRRDESLHKILRRILSDRTLDYMEASRYLTSMGWQREHQYLCLLYQLTYLDRGNLPTNSICNFMEEQYRGCSSFTYEGDIVNFFDLTVTGLPLDEITSRLKPFIRDSYLKAGYSRVMEGHIGLRRQYIQSCLALDVGGRRKPYLWIHHFNQIAMPYILEQITRKLPGSMLCHEKLLVLRKMDKENGTEYMKTLRTYLDQQQNAVRTAKELYIHRSTFLYRLEKIKEILESDLDDTEELLYLNLSFRLLEREES